MQRVVLLVVLAVCACVAAAPRSSPQFVWADKDAAVEQALMDRYFTHAEAPARPAVSRAHELVHLPSPEPSPEPPSERSSGGGKRAGAASSSVDAPAAPRRVPEGMMWKPLLAGGGGDAARRAQRVDIQPAYLEFSKRPVCIPAPESIDIINTSDDDELQVFSINIDSVHFHFTSFKPVTIPPRGKTKLAIIFLPRLVGAVQGKMIIQTSAGGFLYHLRAEGVPNHYQIAPITGVSIPVGVEFAPEIQVYNPHDEVLQVRKVYTSEGFLDLILPGGMSSTTKSAGSPSIQVWQIAPHNKKTVVTLRFSSESPGKYQGFIYLKTDKENTVIPVEIIVTKGSLHRTPEVLDFGTLTSSSETRALNITLMNPGSHTLHVTDIRSPSPDSHLEVKYRRGTLLPPGESHQVAVATYAGRTEGLFTGKLILRTNDTSRVNENMEIPYRARVLHGSVGFHLENTTFLVGEHAPVGDVEKTISLTNRFPVPIQFASAVVESDVFQVSKFSPGTTLGAGETAVLFSVHLHVTGEEQVHHTRVVLHTNASDVEIPLHVHHGKLEYSVERADSDVTMKAKALPPVVDKHAQGDVALDFGMLGVNETRAVLLHLVNRNPVPVHVHEVFTSSPHVHITLDSVRNSHGYREMSARFRADGDAGAGGAAHGDALATDTRTTETDVNELELDLRLEPGHSAMFRCSVRLSSEVQGSEEVVFSTDYETLRVPVTYVSLRGQLAFIPATVRFDPSFRGRVLQRPLSAKSTYDRPVTITGVESSDPRVFPVITQHVLTPNVLTNIGMMVFDASRSATHGDHSTTADAATAAALTTLHEHVDFTRELTQRDVDVFRVRQEKWAELHAKGATDIRATVSVSTNIVQSAELACTGSLAQPQLVEASVLDFPLTQVGSSVVRYVQVHNPADEPITFQLLMYGGDSHTMGGAVGGGAGDTINGTPRLASAHRALQRNLVRGDSGISAALAALVADGGNDDAASSSDTNRTGQSVHAAVPVLRAPQFALDPEHGHGVVVVPPHSHAELGPLHFAPTVLERVTTTVYIRNNLTALAALTVSGQGGSGLLLFEDAHGEPLTSLMLDIRAALLLSADPRRETRRPVRTNTRMEGAPGPLTFARAFVAVNRGNLPVQVHGFDINGMGCHGFGFVVRDCAPFALPPGASVEVSIAFVPDFSASVVKRELRVATSLGDLVFQLEADLPRESMPVLLQSQYVTPFDQWLRAGAFALLVIACGFVAAMSFDDLKDLASVATSATPTEAMTAPPVLLSAIVAGETVGLPPPLTPGRPRRKLVSSMDGVKLEHMTEVSLFASAADADNEDGEAVAQRRTRRVSFDLTVRSRTRRPSFSGGSRVAELKRRAAAHRQKRGEDVAVPKGVLKKTKPLPATNEREQSLRALEREIERELTEKLRKEAEARERKERKEREKREKRAREEEKERERRERKQREQREREEKEREQREQREKAKAKAKAKEEREAREQRERAQREEEERFRAQQAEVERERRALAASAEREKQERRKRELERLERLEREARAQDMAKAKAMVTATTTAAGTPQPRGRRGKKTAVHASSAAQAASSPSPSSSGAPSGGKQKQKQKQKQKKQRSKKMQLPQQIPVPMPRPKPQLAREGSRGLLETPVRVAPPMALAGDTAITPPPGFGLHPPQHVPAPHRTHAHSFRPPPTAPIPVPAPAPMTAPSTAAPGTSLGLIGGGMSMWSTGGGLGGLGSAAGGNGGAASDAASSSFFSTGGMFSPPGSMSATASSVSSASTTSAATPEPVSRPADLFKATTPELVPTARGGAAPPSLFALDTSSSLFRPFDPSASSFSTFGPSGGQLWEEDGTNGGGGGGDAEGNGSASGTPDGEYRQF